MRSTCRTCTTSRNSNASSVIPSQPIFVRRMQLFSKLPYLLRGAPMARISNLVTILGWHSIFSNLYLSTPAYKSVFVAIALHSCPCRNLDAYDHSITGAQTIRPPMHQEYRNVCSPIMPPITNTFPGFQECAQLMRPRSIARKHILRNR